MSQRLLIISALISVAAFGQQRPIQSLYMFDPMLINPAYTGTQVQLSTTAIYRNQWINLEGAPKTFTTSVHSGFLRNKVGLGFIAAADKIGIHEDVSFYGTYAYRINLDKTTSLSMGLQAGFNNFRSDFTKLDLKNPSDPKLGGTLQRLNPNFGSGLYFRHKDYFIGFSVPYILNNQMLKIDTTLFGAQQRRYYYLTGGISLPISDMVQWYPSALFRFQDRAPLSLDINSTFVLFKQIGLGVSYRLKEGLVGLFELQLNDNFHVGYAYDFTVTDLNQFSAGTHELMINYRIKISRIHKGLECPSYW